VKNKQQFDSSRNNYSGETMIIPILVFKGKIMVQLE
jgi:hypothetical protein